MNHLAKLRPVIENLCQQHNFKYHVEENGGRILVKFGEGPGHLSQDDASNYWQTSGNYSQGYQVPSQPQAHQPPQQQYYEQYQQTNQDGDIAEQAILRRLCQCCIIM